MGLMFATRNPSAQELKYIRALLSTFRDGTGNQKEADGSTRASWREIERCISEAVGGPASEDKNIFDVIAPDRARAVLRYGFSIKSKQLSKKSFSALAESGRVHMEIANSPAKFWRDIESATGCKEADFRRMRKADDVGSSVLSSVQRWHTEGKLAYERANPGCVLDLNCSKYLCVSYSAEKIPGARQYQIHAFELGFPPDVSWRYTSPSCLTGFDPAHPSERLFDWYGLSGGQLKYYPRASVATYQSGVFSLLPAPNQFSITDKARLYFPSEFS